MSPLNRFWHWLGWPVRWLLSMIAALWGEVIGLRTEQIRSASFVASVGVLFYALAKMNGDLTDPHFMLALLGLVAMIALAMQATSIKGQWGKAMLALHRDPDPQNRVTYSNTNPENDDVQ